MECPNCKKKYPLNYKGYCCKGCYKKSPLKKEEKKDRREDSSIVEWENQYMEYERMLDDETKKFLKQSEITGMDLFVDGKKQANLWRNPYNQ